MDVATGALRLFFENEPSTNLHRVLPFHKELFGHARLISDNSLHRFNTIAKLPFDRIEPCICLLQIWHHYLVHLELGGLLNEHGEVLDQHLRDLLHLEREPVLDALVDDGQVVEVDFSVEPLLFDVLQLVH